MIRLPKARAWFETNWVFTGLVAAVFLPRSRPCWRRR
jgi:hypothetical protein